MTEDRQTRIKRLLMRSMRRGIKEMDLILQDYSTRTLETLDDETLDLYERMLEESDLELFKWVNGQETPPAVYADLVAQIASGAHGLTAPRT